MAVVKITLTDEDIAEGQGNINNRSTGCAIFLAARRVIPTVFTVGPSRILLTDGVSIPLPPIAQKFVRMADVQTAVATGSIKHDPNDVDMEPLKPISFQVQYIPLSPKEES